MFENIWDLYLLSSIAQSFHICTLFYYNTVRHPWHFSNKLLELLRNPFIYKIIAKTEKYNRNRSNYHIINIWIPLTRDNLHEMCKIKSCIKYDPLLIFFDVVVVVWKCKHIHKKNIWSTQFLGTAQGKSSLIIIII